MSYDRDILVTTLVAHQRANSASCICGWDELGKSHPEHIANEYEKAAGIRRRPKPLDPTHNQLGQFHKGGPSTERGAALDNYPRSGSQKETILIALATDLKDGTADEVREHTGLRFNTTAARLHDLKEGGWLKIVGERPSASGSMSSVFALSETGRAWFDGRIGR